MVEHPSATRRLELLDDLRVVIVVAHSVFIPLFLEGEGSSLMEEIFAEASHKEGVSYS